MQFRQLGRSGLKVPELCFGTGTFGGSNEFFQAWGSTQVDDARKLIDLCMEAGCNFFDTADVYSDGTSEEVLGKAIDHLKREDVLISTKATFRSGKGPNDVGSSRYHLTQALEGSLKRLGTEYIDVYHLHAFDALTPIEETLNTLDKFVREGKVRYIACSNFSGWQLMKSLSTSDRYGWARYAGHQVYYSLIGRWPRTRVWGHWCGRRSAGAASEARFAVDSHCLKAAACKAKWCPTPAHCRRSSMSTGWLTSSMPLPPKPAAPSRSYPWPGCWLNRLFPR